MHIPALPPSLPKCPHGIHCVRVSVHWQVKEKRDGIYVPVRDFHNLLTNYGLTAYASAPSGVYLAPVYMVIDTAMTTMFSQANPGDTQVVLNANPTVVGDNQLVLSIGLGAQETVTFTGVTGSIPYTFTLSGTVANTHPISDPVVRAVTAGDTMASVLGEGQYDPTFNPGNRMAMTSQYSPGVGQSTMQFFFSGTTATNMFFAHVGLADQQVIGNPVTNLHNYAVLGYNHNNTNDLEVDVTYLLQTF